MKFPNNEDLQTALLKLKEGRKSLVEEYKDRNNDRYHYSFKYYNSLTAIQMVSELTYHQWIDKELEEKYNQFKEKEISQTSFYLIAGVFKELLSISNLDFMVSETLRTVNQIKIEALNTFLTTKSEWDKKSRMLEFDYIRDKVLFEKEITKYEKELGNNKNK